MTVMQNMKLKNDANEPQREKRRLTLVVTDASKILCFLLRAVSRDILVLKECKAARTEARRSLMVMFDTKQLW